jgi:hypothetical protein
MPHAFDEHDLCPCGLRRIVAWAQGRNDDGSVAYRSVELPWLYRFEGAHLITSFEPACEEEIFYDVLRVPDKVEEGEQPLERLNLRNGEFMQWRNVRKAPASYNETHWPKGQATELAQQYGGYIGPGTKRKDI